MDGVLVTMPIARYHGRMFPPIRRIIVHQQIIERTEGRV
jgi:hypothetical protein